MKVYEITFNDEEKVSLVKSPAVESTLLKFSDEENETLYFTNEEKQEVYSVAMIPNKMIFRKNVMGEPANVYYTSSTIEKFQQNYFRKNANSGTNINHAEFNTDGIFPFESWIVLNSENDKSKELGLTAPNGSLIMGFKIENDEVWNDVKNGNLDGLSVEGKVIFKEVEPNINIQMNKEKNPQTLWDMMKSFFAVDVKDEEETTEEESTETPKDEEVEMAEVEVEVPVEQSVIDLKAENETLKAEVSDLKNQLATLEAEKVKAEEELVTMTKQTAASEPIKNTPIEVVLTPEQLKFERFKQMT